MSTTSIRESLDQDYSISITHIPINKTVSFSGFVSSFKDNFKINWQEEQAYGRMDSIYSYKNTTRNINIEFMAVSENQLIAEANFIKLQTLLSFSYPVYEATKQEFVSFTKTSTERKEIDKSLEGTKTIPGNAMLISQPPLLAFRFSNLINSNSQILQSKLIGKVNELSYNMDPDGVFYSKEGKLIPDRFKINLNIDVIHSSPLGWIKVGDRYQLRDKNKKFPYGF